MSKEETLKTLEKRLIDKSLEGNCPICGDSIRKDFTPIKHDMLCSGCLDNIKGMRTDMSESIPKWILTPDNNTLRKLMIEKDLDEWVMDSIEECKDYAGFKKTYKKYPNETKEIVRNYCIDTLENPGKKTLPLAHMVLKALDPDIQVNYTIEKLIKTNARFNEVYKRYPVAIRELFRRFYLYPEKDKMEIFKEVKAEFGIDGNEMVYASEERKEEKDDKDFNHRLIIEKFNKLKLKHPEYGERRLLEEVFSRISNVYGEENNG